jgi:tRNA-modifying protein YgfZ
MHALNDLKNLNNYLTLIEVSGEDAAQFLHNQFTQSVLDLSETQAKLFAYCNIKGRVIVNGIMYFSSGKYYLLIATDLVATFVKRLSMFILRSKVKIQACENIDVKYIENNEASIQNIINNDNRLTIKLNTAECCCIAWVENRCICISIPEHNDNIAYKELTALDWRLDSIKTFNLCLVQRDTSELYLPQMLNLDKLDAVNFKKGCYPGQEIVARTQYLGKVKKSVFYAYMDNNIDYDFTTTTNVNINTYLKKSMLDSDINLDIDIEVVDMVDISNTLHMLVCIRLEDMEKENFDLYLSDKKIKITQ